MTNDQIKQSLIEIRESLANADSVDDETLALAKALEDDFDRLEARDADQDLDLSNSMDLATALETRFEADHPVAANLLREVINALHKMGI